MSMVTVPERVGVYGGGRMGSGIAHAFAVVGAEVTVVEQDDASAAAARARIEASLAKSAERGVAVAGAVTVVLDAAAMSACSLVVESVPEDLDLKREVLRRIDEAAPEAALGTNTSALSVDTLAEAIGDPSRLVGLHFFNPVPVSDLVEIVVGRRTDAGLVEDARGWVEAIGKTAITVTDTPGFASSRLGVALALEAIRMLEEGVATAADIDAAMTLGYRHALGPLRTTDVVGLDVRLNIATQLAIDLGERFDPPALLRAKVASGELGRKTGRGFYSW